MKIILTIFILLIFIGCNTTKQKLEATIEKWYNKEIIFTDNLEAKIFGKDTILLDILNANYKIFNYVDTSGCTECQLKLYDWKLMKDKVDSLNLNVKFIFIAWVDDFKKLEYFQKINQFDIPSFYDRDGEMQRINNFPKISNLHTFLLDSNNKVILIGNPIKNKKLYELYINTIIQKNN